MFMHNSMHRLQLHIREPNEDHQVASHDLFLAHANWSKGRPFSREEEVGHEKEGNGDPSPEDEE